MMADEDWEPDDLDTETTDAPAAQKPAATPASAAKPEDTPITRAQAQTLFQQAAAAAKEELAKEASVAQTQQVINEVVDKNLRSTCTEWFDKQPVDVRTAARTVAINRVAGMPEVAKMTDDEFNAELAKAAEAVAREITGTPAPEGKQGTTEELTKRMDASRATGESGVNKTRRVREESNNPDIDHPMYGVSEDRRWASSDEIDHALKEDLRSASF